VKSAPKALLLAASLAVIAVSAAACGSEGVQVNDRGAKLFSERCSGCHSLAVAGAQGSIGERISGPNLDYRKETKDTVLYAIRNGGFSGAIMPQNIVVGGDAEAVARFLEKWSGGEAESALAPAEGKEAPPSGGEKGSASGSGAEQ
jgi:cytochrome c551